MHDGLLKLDQSQACFKFSKKEPLVRSIDFKFPLHKDLPVTSKKQKLCFGNVLLSDAETFKIYRAISFRGSFSDDSPIQR